MSGVGRARNEYCVVEDPHRPGTYMARVPSTTKGKDIKRRFAKTKYHNPRSAAILWRDKTGREEWGIARWDKILLTRSVRRFRSDKHGVYVTKVKSGGERDIWLVEWRDLCRNKGSKCFSKKRYGTLEAAEVAANDFAAMIRAKELSERPISQAQFEFDNEY